MTTMQEGKTYRGVVKGTGEEILGTYEMCPARADITHFYLDPANAEDGGVGWEHEGYTEMFYDGQITQSKNNKTVFLCAEGNEWTIDDIEFEEIE